jgi:uncharacterized protein (TIGR03083 family)
LLRPPEPILTAHRFAPLHSELVMLLRSLTPDEWNAPTVAGSWTVSDVAAHLLDTAIRRLAIQRDGHLPPGPFDPNAMNRIWVEASRRLSPTVLTEMIETYGLQQVTYFESLDPFAGAPWGVQWAGEERSPMWFDMARELTERWHHQEQIRNAIGRPSLIEHRAAVIDTFVRGLPYNYREVAAPESTSVVVKIDDDVWSLVRQGNWKLFSGEVEKPTSRVTMDGDVAWRVFTKGLKRENVRASVEGEPSWAEPVLSMVAVIG